jgi:hypothetical protein
MLLVKSGRARFYRNLKGKGTGLPGRFPCQLMAKGLRIRIVPFRHPPKSPLSKELSRNSNIDSLTECRVSLNPKITSTPWHPFKGRQEGGLPE